MGLQRVGHDWATELNCTLVVKLVCWCWRLFTFVCLEFFLFLHQFWMRSLPCTVILIVDFSLSIVSIYPAIPFWPAKFFAKKSAVKHMGFSFYVTCCFSFSAFNRLSLCFIFVSLINMYLGMFLLGFILYGTHCVSWTWLIISSSMLVKFSTIISSKNFLVLFLFLFFFWDLYNSMLVLLI